MTQMGIIHILSVIYVSGVICVAVSVNENRDPKRIVRESARRFVKFIGVTILIAIVVSLLSNA